MGAAVAINAIQLQDIFLKFHQKILNFQQPKIHFNCTQVLQKQSTILVVQFGYIA